MEIRVKLNIMGSTLFKNKLTKISTILGFDPVNPKCVGIVVIAIKVMFKGTFG